MLLMRLRNYTTSNMRSSLCLLTRRRRVVGLGARDATPLTAAQRFHAAFSSTTLSHCRSARTDNTGKSGRIIDTPAPPRPAFYVPPEQRAPDDESLAFMQQPDSPLRALEEARRRRLTQAQPGGADERVAVAQGEDAQAAVVGAAHTAPSPAATPRAPLASGQQRAPSLPEQEPARRRFMDADAERLQSTSVHAGHSLLKGNNIDSADFELPPRKPRTPPRAGSGAGGGLSEGSFATHAVQEAATSERGSSAKAADGGSLFKPVLEDASPEDLAQDRRHAKVAAEAAATSAQKPRRRQLEEDIKKLEYYYGSPHYPAMLKAFQAKYGKEGQEKGDETADSSMGTAERAYSSDDMARGLASQPIDYLRSSSKLQTHLTSGPHAYDPVTVMQQHGLMRFQGYAFPPTTELGKLKGMDDYKALQDAHKESAVVRRVRQSFNALMHRQSDKDDFLATEPKKEGDNSLVYRATGLDAVQRRQMRFMLTDFDYADRHTAFHVMMSYPYTDWLHAFYMVLVGWALYQLQIKYNAYDFYDEYLGLDLRQVPSLKKPLLIAITCTVMVFLLFQPLLVASIATNRAYRIVTRRPIGPP